MMSALVHAHAGRAAVVMGGAPSLLDELGDCPSDALYISAKEHGAMVREVDYLVCVDNVEAEQRAYARGAPIIAPHQWADHVLVAGAPVANSGAVAAWCAWIMGCAPIIVVGCQCYTTGTYFHDPKRYTTGRGVTLEQHLLKWERIRALSPNHMYRVMRGPLLKVLPQYKEGERVRPLAPRDIMLKACRGTVVEFLQSFPPLRAKAGERHEVHPNDASNLRTARIAKLVPSH